MMQSLLFLAGYACGAVTVSVLVAIYYYQGRPRPRRAELPPATASQIKRAARANRIEVRTRPRWVAPPADDFPFDDGTTK